MIKKRKAGPAVAALALFALLAGFGLKHVIDDRDAVVSDGTWTAYDISQSSNHFVAYTLNLDCGHPEAQRPKVDYEHDRITVTFSFIQDAGFHTCGAPIATENPEDPRQWLGGTYHPTYEVKLREPVGNRKVIDGFDGAVIFDPTVTGSERTVPSPEKRLRAKGI